ncbi:MAG: deoxyribose-phosphate aldolase [Bacteroidales bacterium]|nr:deoxyribose-phosphate aldolase [Lentimicrobiaceae bacterium]MDD5693708.1 deoxyribose-phosphate aldolase [Bacteroidales bacterium]
MNSVFHSYDVTLDQAEQRVRHLLSEDFDHPGLQQILKHLIGSIDLTTLEGADTTRKVNQLCEKAKRIGDTARRIPPVAAVCVYSPFVSIARKNLVHTGIKVACAAGGFPSGQLPLSLKLQEIHFALDEGADEIDTVISRGKLLEGNEQEVYDEIASIRAICSDRTLKVILETGELQSVEMIRRASEIAILAGADFIKTSTGKIQPAATETAVLIMLDTIREFEVATGKRVGIKPAGGIQQPEQAIRYYRLVRLITGDAWIDPNLFRIGASRLLDNLLNGLNINRL